MLRMCTCPPIAQDRLVGLAGISKNLLKNMENENRMLSQMDVNEIITHLSRISSVIRELLDIDIFPWLRRHDTPKDVDLARALSIVSDRICGSLCNPILRNAQEERQFNVIIAYLEELEYTPASTGIKWTEMLPGTYLKRANAQGRQSDGQHVNISIDIIIKPHSSSLSSMPVLIEAKSAGDAT